ncbi:glycoside hydrolase superfamily [Xylogone sp. PMI_703]|nr:glycoside hydrolase superfamily [Xylogone sp. PMI_703]
MLLRAFYALSLLCLAGTLTVPVSEYAEGRRDVSKSEQLQNIVTWDEHSIFVRGERIMLFSGEFHPFRLPVPGLWLDVFQKIKAMGFTCVSFYVDWSLVQGNSGEPVFDGIWSLDGFFRAATEAGIYLIARPGPYINAETTAGGIPGWVLRTKATIRSLSQEYLNATQKYISAVGKIIADAQITNGGPVILVQPENEYSTWPGVTNFPNEMNKEYMAYVEQQFRDAGIVVPLMDNDNLVQGFFAPGTGVGAVDLYGIDAYPLRYDCAHPYTWPTIRWPQNWQISHREQSPNTPFAIAEFQGGTGSGWGGVTEDQCAILVNEEAERVVYKNNYAFGVTIFNIYMTYGGTNWGNLGYHGGYTSYDYGAAITEDRLIWREKYSELKLQANFVKASPAYLTAFAGNSVNGSYGAPDSITVTPVLDIKSKTGFYVVRHADFTSTDDTQYQLTVSTSIGNVTIPQLGGHLSLNGRDSKIHVTDYNVGGVNLLYSSAEIFTWASGAGSARTLILYGGEGETHEAAFPSHLGRPSIVEGHGVTIKQKGAAWVIQWSTTPTRRIIQIGSLEVYLLWRNEAYNYWVLELPAAGPVGSFSSPSKEKVIVKAGYLLRSAKIAGTELQLTGDTNSTTSVEVISVPSSKISAISLNGQHLRVSKTSGGKLTSTVSYKAPHINLPNLSQLSWRYIDSLPEIQSGYQDRDWTSLSHTSTTNPRNLSTPTSLYALDYGYHTGSFIYRGHFTSNGQEETLFLNTSGGVGYAHSVWLNDAFLSSWTGAGGVQTYIHNISLAAKLEPRKEYVLTVLIDHMGYDEEAPGTDAIKFPRGILNFGISGHSQDDVKWKMTGNLGGENYRDHVRGPLNEGSMYAERQGYHLPSPPTSKWKKSNPVQDGISHAGIGFFATSFNLNIPKGYDVPLSFVFNTSSSTSSSASAGNNYRCQLYVNGYQFGKYVNNLGPQTVFPVPEGIINHGGKNYIALTLWALDQSGAKINGIELVSTSVIQSGYQSPAAAPQPGWQRRIGAY